jgi:biopolymer transport protein ExbB
MRKYAILAIAMLCLAAPSQSQERVDLPASLQGGLEKASLPPASPGPPAVRMNDPALSSKAPSALRELSLWSMFLSADALVKAVMIGLAFASFVSWTIFLAKSAKLHLATWQLRKSLTRISAAKTLAEAQLALGRSRDVLTILLLAAIQEVHMSADVIGDVGVKERAASRSSEIVRTEARVARQGMVVLGTIGTTAPFMGLFGTVWGIMNSFIGISQSQTTNLAVVAPGIAEALLATACGLAAAIPAVIFYNQLTRTMRGYLDLVGRASGAAGRLLSRDLERAHRRLDSRAAE